LLSKVFRGTKVNQFITINELSKKYGPVFTLWLGNTPTVIISDLEILKKVFNSKENELMGRPDATIRRLITQNNGNDVVFTDHGPIWASLRRVAHSAVRFIFNSYFNLYSKLNQFICKSVEKL
jgi:cytochrome P450